MPLPSEPQEQTIEYLMLGEGNFGFTCAFIKKHPSRAQHIVSTELRTKEEVLAMYKDAAGNIAFLEAQGVKLRFGIDATQLGAHFPNTHVKRIYFNAPHDDSLHDETTTNTVSALVAGIFEGARQIQKLESDQLYLGLSPTSFNLAIRYEIEQACTKMGYLFKEALWLVKDPIKKGEDEHTRYGALYLPVQTKKDESHKDNLRQYIFNYSHLSPSEAAKWHTDRELIKRLPAEILPALLLDGHQSTGRFIVAPELKNESSGSEGELDVACRLTEKAKTRRTRTERQKIRAAEVAEGKAARAIQGAERDQEKAKELAEKAAALQEAAEEAAIQAAEAIEEAEAIDSLAADTSKIEKAQARATKMAEKAAKAQGLSENASHKAIQATEKANGVKIKAFAARDEATTTTKRRRETVSPSPHASISNGESVLSATENLPPPISSDACATVMTSSEVATPQKLPTPPQIAHQHKRAKKAVRRSSLFPEAPSQRWLSTINLDPNAPERERDASPSQSL